MTNFVAVDKSIRLQQLIRFAIETFQWLGMQENRVHMIPYKYPLPQ